MGSCFRYCCSTPGTADSFCPTLALWLHVGKGTAAPHWRHLWHHRCTTDPASCRCALCKNTGALLQPAPSLSALPSVLMLLPCQGGLFRWGASSAISRTWLAFFPSPMRKLSGLMSLWMKLRACTNSTRDNCRHRAGEAEQRTASGGLTSTAQTNPQPSLFRWPSPACHT